MLCGVFGGQFVTRLEAGYRLMLRAVVHKGALDIGHKRNEVEIGYENAYLHKSLDYCGYNGSHRLCAEKVKQKIDACGNPDRKENEEQNRKGETEYYGNYHNQVGKSHSKLLRHPFFELAGVLLLVKSHSIGRCPQGFHAEYHHFNEVYNSANNGKVKYFMFFSDRDEARVGDRKCAVLFAAGGNGARAGLHHNALKDRLTSDLTEARAAARHVAFFIFTHFGLPLDYPVL